MKPHATTDQPAPEAVDSVLRSLDSHDILTLKVQGDCMWPSIGTGETVHIRRRKILLPGDILLQRNHSGHLTLHRLLGTYRRAGKWHYITRADRAHSADAAVGEERMIGKVSGVASRQNSIRIPLAVRLQCVGPFVILAMKRLIAVRQDHP